MSTVRVDPDALRTLAYASDAEAEIIGALKPATALVAAEAAMQSSAVGGAVRRSSAPLDTAYLAMANCLRRMAEAVSAAAVDCDVAEEEIGRQLSAIGTGFDKAVP